MESVDTLANCGDSENDGRGDEVDKEWWRDMYMYFRVQVTIQVLLSIPNHSRHRQSILHFHLPLWPNSLTVTYIYLSSRSINLIPNGNFLSLSLVLPHLPSPLCPTWPSGFYPVLVSSKCTLFISSYKLAASRRSRRYYQTRTPIFPFFMGISGITARIFVTNCIMFIVKCIIFISRK